MTRKGQGMTRKEAINVIYEVINSGIISEEIEDNLQKIINCICEDDFDDCEADCDTVYCEGCPFLKNNEEEDDEDDFDDEDFDDEEE